ncbi:CRISPR-associated protein Cas5 [Desulfogranum mediterraneum]|uniref:CRISPR-associated protein Cas5 n=1 Tax=Desulfogranum mediterraneum TaxID=160661 RepID=UPI000A0247E5|nr:CRISPR-associated protein Cas5 [Desulfogranum mediterraneum]
MRNYEITMEIAGPFAMWSRPDTGATPTSYPVPTWSAAKGIFESVAFFSDGKAWIRPVKVQICRPKWQKGGELFFQHYTNNYRGPLRKSGKDNFQFTTLILVDVCYRLYGHVENGSGRHLRHGDNPPHALQAIFQRRLQKGQCHKTPTLGWNEFVPSYWGPFRENGLFQTERDLDVNVNVISMLSQVFSRAVCGSYSPRFTQGEGALIKEGELRYAQ